MSIPSRFFPMCFAALLIVVATVRSPAQQREPGLYAKFDTSMGEIVVSPASSNLVANMSPENMRGRYMGVYGLFSQFGWSMGPLAGGILMDAFVGTGEFPRIVEIEQASPRARGKGRGAISTRPRSRAGRRTASPCSDPTGSSDR